MKNITGDEDLTTPIFFIFMYSMMFVGEARDLMENLTSYRSIMVIEPILFTSNIFETMARFSLLLIGIIIVYIATAQKQLSLKLIYLLAALPFFLSPRLIDTIGDKSLYIIKAGAVFMVVVFLMYHVIKTIQLYQTALRQQWKMNNNYPE